MIGSKHAHVQFVAILFGSVSGKNISRVEEQFESFQILLSNDLANFTIRGQ